MRVFINGHGLVEFKPTELHRFDGREDMTQLRGQVRIAKLTEAYDWQDYNFWFRLDQIIIDSTDDLNLMVGLKVVTTDELMGDGVMHKTGPESIEFRVGQEDAVLILDGKNKPEGIKWQDIGMALRGYRVVRLHNDEQFTSSVNVNGDDVVVKNKVETQIDKLVESLDSYDVTDPAELKHYINIVNTINTLSSVI